MYKYPIVHIQFIFVVYYITNHGGVQVKKVLLIKNPRAGKDSKRLSSEDIIKAFREHDIECIEKLTTCPGDGVNIAEKYATDYDAVVCCGGDGTYNEVINGMMKAEADNPIIYLPCGSTNDLAHTLGISNDPKKAAQMYVEKLIHKFDIGKFNEKYFSYVASFGMATEIAYSTSQKVKNMLGRSAYLINGFVVKLVPMIKNTKPAHMKIEHDGGVIEDKFYFGAVANTNEISGLFKLENEGIKMNDGLFELLLVKARGLKDLASVFTKALRQDFSDENVILLKTKNLKITSEDDVAWTLDGEYGGAHNIVNINVMKEAIDVVSPMVKFL